MREQLERLLVVLAVGSAAAVVAKRIRIPYNVAIVIVGFLLVVLDVLPSGRMDPDIIMLAFLPALVFEGALFANADSLRAARRPILALAVPGVVISLLGTAAFATFALNLPFTVALLLGALLAITDTVSVLVAFRSVRVPHRLAAIMEGESLFNDGTALVLVSVSIGIVTSGRLAGADVIRALGLAMIGGIAVGAAFGAVGTALLRRMPDHLTTILGSMVLVFATAFIAERAHASPVIAVVVAGLMIGKAVRQHLEPSRVIALHSFWETTGFTLNVVLFLLVGMQIHAETLLQEAASIGLALVALHAGRAIAVYGCFALLRVLSRERVPMRWQHAMLIGNIKGALSMAAVLALPVGFPSRERLVTIVFGITFVTLVMQGLPFRWLLQALRLSRGSADVRRERAKATLVAARSGLAGLDELLSSGLISRKDHARRRAEFQRRIIHAEEILRQSEAVGWRDDVVDLALVTAQKSAVLDAARRGLISAEAAASEVNDFDDALVKLSTPVQGDD